MKESFLVLVTIGLFVIHASSFVLEKDFGLDESSVDNEILSRADDCSAYKGIPNPSGSACCAKKCGKCGGSGCSKRPGGKKNCCTGNIKKNCGPNQKAPCRPPTKTKDTEKPTNSEDLNETEDPTTTDDQNETEEPTNTDESTETEEPANTEEPNETEDPTNTDEQNENEEPENTDEPTETDEPTTTEEPNGTDEPATGDEPTETEEPTNTDETTETDEPTTTDETNETKEPETPEKPTDTEEPTNEDESSTTTEGGCSSLSGDKIVQVCEQSDESNGFCEVQIKTDKKTCNQACSDGGMTCKDGWDNKNGEVCIKKVGWNGCDMKLGEQICRCVPETTDETTTLEMCCPKQGRLEQPSDEPNHGDVCRQFDFTKQPANPTDWYCPPGCDKKDVSPWCAKEGTMNACRVEEGKDCGASVCPDSHPILDPAPNNPNHGDVCRAMDHKHTCPKGCEVSSKFYCSNEGKDEPCRT